MSATMSFERASSATPLTPTSGRHFVSPSRFLCSQILLSFLPTKHKYTRHLDALRSPRPLRVSVPDFHTGMKPKAKVIFFEGKKILFQDVDEPERLCIKVSVWDWDKWNEDDLIGTSEIDIDTNGM